MKATDILNISMTANGSTEKEILKCLDYLYSNEKEIRKKVESEFNTECPDNVEDVYSLEVDFFSMPC